MAAADSIILEEEIDPNYEPTEEEIQEYAKWLGMDMEKDKDLFWIAKEGLKAPLPENWKPCKTQDTGEIYYFNFQSGESTWDHPCDEYYRSQYEEHRAKQATNSMKAAQDTKKQQAAKDVALLLGKEEKKEKKKKKSKGIAELGPPGGRSSGLSLPTPSLGGSTLGAKPFPGLGASLPGSDPFSRKPLGMPKLASSLDGPASLKPASNNELEESEADGFQDNTEELNNLKKDNEKEIKAIKEKHQKAKEDLETKNEKEIEELVEEHAQKLKKVKKDNQKQLEDIEEEFDNTKEELIKKKKKQQKAEIEKADEDLEDLKEENKKAIEKLKNKLKEEEEKVAEKMKELEKNMKDKKAELSALIEQLENQQESLRNAPPPQKREEIDASNSSKVNDLEKEVEELKKEIKKLEKEKSGLEEEIGEVKADKKEVEKKLELKKQEVNGLEESQAQLEKKAKELENEIKELKKHPIPEVLAAPIPQTETNDEEINELQKQLQNAFEKVESLQDKLASTEDELQQNKDALKAAQQASQANSSQNDQELQDTNEKLQNVENKLQRTEKELKEAKAALDIAEKSASSSLTDKDQAFQNLQNSLRETQEQLNQKTDEIPKIQREKDELQRKLDQLQHDLGSAKDGSTTLQDELTKLRQEKDQLEKSNKALSSSMTEAEEQLQDVRKHKDAEINRLQEQLESIKDAKSDSNSVWEAEKRSFQQEIKDLRGHIETLDQQLSDLKQKCKFLEESNIDIEHCKSSAQQSASDFESKLKKLNAEHEYQREQSTKTIEELRQKLKTLQENQADIEQQKNSFREQLESAQFQKKKAEDEIAYLNDKLKDNIESQAGDVRILRLELEEARTKITTKSSEIEQLQSKDLKLQKENLETQMQNKSLQRTVEEGERRLTQTQADLQTQIDRLTHELEYERSKANQAQADLIGQSGKDALLKRLEEESREARASERKCRDEMDRLRRKTDEAEAKAAEVEASGLARIDSLDFELNLLQKDNENLSKSKKDLEREREELQSKIMKLGEEQRSKQLDLERRRMEADQLKVQLESAEATILETQRRLNQVLIDATQPGDEKFSEEMEARITMLRQENLQLSNDLMKVRQEVKTLEYQIKLNESSRTSLDARYERTKQEIEAWESRYKALEGEKSNLEDAFRKFQTESAVLLQQHQVVEQERVTWAKEKNKLLDEIKHIKQEKEGMIDSVTLSKRENELQKSTIRKLEADLFEREANCRLHQSELEDSKFKLNQAFSDLKMQKLEVSALTSRLEMAEKTGIERRSAQISGYESMAQQPNLQWQYQPQQQVPPQLNADYQQQLIQRLEYLEGLVTQKKSNKPEKRNRRQKNNSDSDETETPPKDNSKQTKRERKLLDHERLELKEMKSRIKSQQKELDEHQKFWQKQSSKLKYAGTTHDSKRQWKVLQDAKLTLDRKCRALNAQVNEIRAREKSLEERTLKLSDDKHYPSHYTFPDSPLSENPDIRRLYEDFKMHSRVDSFSDLDSSEFSSSIPLSSRKHASKTPIKVLKKAKSAATISQEPVGPLYAASQQNAYTNPQFAYIQPSAGFPGPVPVMSVPPTPSFGQMYGYQQPQPYQTPIGFRRAWPPTVPETKWATSMADTHPDYPPQPDEALLRQASPLVQPHVDMHRTLNNAQKGYRQWNANRAEAENAVADHVGWLTELRSEMTLRNYGSNLKGSHASPISSARLNVQSDDDGSLSSQRGKY